MNVQRIGWALLVISFLAAVATLLGPAERVLGVDLGPTGAAVFVLSVAGGMCLLAKRGDEVFAEHMSVTERRAWIGVGFLAIILANFTLGMMALADHGEPPQRIGDFQARFPARLGLLIGAWLFCASLIGDDDPFETDERDLRHQHRADRAANLMLNLIVIGAAVMLISVPRDALSLWLSPIVLANVLIGVLIFRALVEHVVLAVSYRRP